MARSRDQIAEQISGILTQRFGVSASAISEAARIGADLQLESLQAVELLAHVHKAFGFRAAMEDYQEVETFGALVSFVEKVLAGRGEETR